MLSCESIFFAVLVLWLVESIKSRLDSPLLRILRVVGITERIIFYISPTIYLSSKALIFAVFMKLLRENFRE